MLIKSSFIERMSDADLVAAAVRFAGDERRATADLIALMAEVDKRRLYLGQGCSSLFTFCTRVLRFSDHEAYLRMEVARMARQFPSVLERVASGSVTLTNVALLRPHLTHENHEKLLEAIHQKSKREVEQLIANLAPKPDVVSMLRRLPNADPVTVDVAQRQLIQEPACVPPLVLAPQIAPATRPASPKVAALGTDRYLLRVTLSAGAHDKLRRAQDLMRHSVPNGDPAEIVDRALTLLVEHLEKTKCAAADRPRSQAQPVSKNIVASRYIPAAVKREVWSRDQGRCAFVGEQGRCAETGRLEFHHIEPFALGGRSDASNISLRCRAHNCFESELVFALSS